MPEPVRTIKLVGDDPVALLARAMGMVPAGAAVAAIEMERVEASEALNWRCIVTWRDSKRGPATSAPG